MRRLSALSAAPVPLLLLLLPLVAPATAASAGKRAELDIKVTKAVSCTRRTDVGDSISVHYRGSLQSDGSVFDESYKRGQPFEFVLGEGHVIEGWDRGLQAMCIGEARRLTIPPEMGYGRSGMGRIPPDSVLIFETELMGIAGVDPNAEPTAPADTTSTPAPTTAHEDPKHGHGGGPKHRPPPPDGGECRLLGPFALLIQAALGALALLSLVWKRYRETPRRPMKVWTFDVSKQVVGSILLHLANLFMSMLSSGDLSKAAEERLEAAKPDFIKNKDLPNPCSFYLLNLAIDTTIGIPILVGLLRVLHALFIQTPLANPPESIRSGNYGHPPRATWWLKQSLIYFLGLFGMKLCVFIIFQLLPWLGWVGDWALRWTEGNEAVQIAFVMLIFPLIMNALQYYIIDSFIKDPEGGAGHEQIIPGDGEEDEEERRHLRRGSLDSNEDIEEDVSDRESDEARKKPSRVNKKEALLKEANPTPIPDYDPDVDGASSSSPRSSRSGPESKELGKK